MVTSISPDWLDHAKTHAVPAAAKAWVDAWHFALPNDPTQLLQQCGGGHVQHVCSMVDANAKYGVLRMPNPFVPVDKSGYHIVAATK